MSEHRVTEWILAIAIIITSVVGALVMREIWISGMSQMAVVYP